MLSNGLLTRIFIIPVLAAFLGACSTTPDVETAPDTDTSPVAVPTDDVGPATSIGPAAGSQDDLDATAGDRVFFEYDSAELTATARRTLQAQADWLRANNGVAVTIEGHADERGTREYNLALGDRRATAAKNYLVALGISGSRVATISYGKERPADGGSDESAWAKNRRGRMAVN